MNTSRLSTFALLSFVFMGLMACSSPTNSGGGEQDSAVLMEDLNIPDNFDWKTQREITFQLQGYETGMVRLLAEDGTEYHRANLIENSEYSFDLTVPAYMERITMVYRGQQQQVELNRPDIAHTFTPQNP